MTPVRSGSFYVIVLLLHEHSLRIAFLGNLNVYLNFGCLLNQATSLKVRFFNARRFAGNHGNGIYW